jgi:hypothetical protein
MPRVLVSIRDSTERTTSFGLHTTQPCRPNWSKFFTLVPLEVTLEQLPHITDSRGTFIGKAWRRIWIATSSNVPCASMQNKVTPIQQASSNPYQYLLVSGRTCPWILLRDSPNQKATQSYWW